VLKKVRADERDAVLGQHRKFQPSNIDLVDETISISRRYLVRISHIRDDGFVLGDVIPSKREKEREREREQPHYRQRFVSINVDIHFPINVHVRRTWDTHLCVCMCTHGLQVRTSALHRLLSRCRSRLS